MTSDRCVKNTQKLVAFFAPAKKTAIITEPLYLIELMICDAATY